MEYPTLSLIPAQLLREDPKSIFKEEFAASRRLSSKLLPNINPLPSHVIVLCIVGNVLLPIVAFIIRIIPFMTDNMGTFMMSSRDTVRIFLTCIPQF